MIAPLQHISAPTRRAQRIHRRGALAQAAARRGGREGAPSYPRYARRHGVGLASSRPGGWRSAMCASLGGAPEASVVGTRIRTSAVNAALANGMLAHADETDDSHAPSRTHPGCAVVPAALAVAERSMPPAKRFLRAVVLGYDVCARVNMALGAGRACRGLAQHPQRRRRVRRRRRRRRAARTRRRAGAPPALLLRPAGLGRRLQRA